MLYMLLYVQFAIGDYFLPCLASMIPPGNRLCSLIYVLCEEMICGVYSRPTAR